MQLFTENDMINSVYSVFKLEEIPCPSPNLLSINYFPDSPQMHFEYEHIYLQFLETFHQQHHQSITDTITTTTSNPDSNINMLDQEYSKTTEENVREDQDDVVVIRKMTRCGNSTTTNNTSRRSKKDRHSKINTARGPRDRRMRLSLEVARKFFDLQDLLGFDKPSKTVDWLLENSRDAIRELASDGNYSCCEVVSSITTTSDQEFACSNNYSSPPPFANKGLSEVETRNPSSLSSDKNNVRRVISRKKKENKKKKNLVTVERESRRRARERARERTSQKRRLNEIITTTDRDQQISKLCIVDELSSAGDQKAHTYDDTDYNELVRLKDILAPTSNYCSSIFGKYKDHVN